MGDPQKLGEVIVFQAGDGLPRVDVRFEDETVWILSWASRFDDASYEAKHLVIAQLVDRIEIRKNDGYDITIHWRMTAEQFLGRKTEASA